MKRKQTILFTLSLFLFACIFPMEATQPAVLHPTTDANSLSIVIAQTGQAANAQTQAAITPTNTIPPTELVISPTATLIPPTFALPEQGTYLSKQENGSTQFFDQTAGYDLVIPSGWIAVRVKGPEYTEALTLAASASASAEFQTALKNTQGQNADVFRLFAFNLKESSTASPFIMNMNFVWEQQDTNTLEEAMKKIESQYPKIFPGIQIINLGIYPTTKNIPGGLIESVWITKNASGQEISIYQKQAIFKLRTGTLAITLSVATQLRETTTQIFDLVISSLNIK